jgi:ABC-2 type transport system permease protein
MLSILVQAVGRRRVGLLGWSAGLLGVVGLLAVSYPTIRGNDELDRTFADLSPGVRQLLGLAGGGGLTSPSGYLNSQFFANLLPVMLLVFGIGVAAWAIAGDEAAGTLELLLANPVGRTRVALARFAALAAMLALLGTVTAVGLLVMSPPAGLTDGLSGGRLVAATVGCTLLALTHATLAFAVGAATGRRVAALATAGVVAVLGYVAEGLAASLDALRPVRAASPWHWFLDADPLRNGLPTVAWVLPLVVTMGLLTLGTAAFSRRDLH